MGLNGINKNSTKDKFTTNRITAYQASIKTIPKKQIND